MPDVAEVLTGLQELCRRYGYEDKAAYIEGVLHEDGAARFWEAVSGLEFWGGAGAVWELEPFELSHPHVSGARDDYRRFQQLMVELAGILEARGLSRYAAPRGRYFERQLRDPS